MNAQNGSKQIRVGVVFGGRSGEHEVSLASASNVMQALDQAGYDVVPIGITRQGKWLTSGDIHARLTELTTKQPTRLNASRGTHRTNGAQPATTHQQDGWGLVPQDAKENSLPAIDIVFPVLHGPYGEDGTVQGLLEVANVPYVGCGVLSSALAMDKAVCKQIFTAAGIEQARWRIVLRTKWESDQEATVEAMEASFDYPMFVKPANLGSSVGVSKARNREQLVAAIDLACEYDRKIVVEEAVANPREIEVSVLGNEDPVASVPGEVVPGNEFYDYAAKYIDDNSGLIIPADLPQDQIRHIQETAICAFRAVDGSGLARVDFLLNDKTGVLYLNELNTLPGFTRISMYPKLWEATGVSYPDLVDKLIQLGLERHQDRQRNRVTR